mmetsp:Transcript_5309/g.13201  ORF Transcript_5309/g.13201 Transcript_5309/m.13201 type:complete len:219 (+) Transcript_5309:552-1208(+)
MIRNVERKPRLDAQPPPAQQARRWWRRQGWREGVPLSLRYEVNRARDADPDAGVIHAVHVVHAVVEGEAIWESILFLRLLFPAQLLLQGLQLIRYIQARRRFRGSGGRRCRLLRFRCLGRGVGLDVFAWRALDEDLDLQLQIAIVRHQRANVVVFDFFLVGLSRLAGGRRQGRVVTGLLPGGGSGRGLGLGYELVVRLLHLPLVALAFGLQQRLVIFL